MAERPPTNFPCKWIAKQVQVVDNTHNSVCRILKGTDMFDNFEGIVEDENSQASTPDG
jgi:hypothetical protein